MDKTTLATFRIDKKTWKEFKKWAGDRGSNASAELNQFILRALGHIDENLETALDNDLDTTLNERIKNYLDANLEQRIEETVNNYLDANLEKHIYNVTLKYVDKEQDPDIETHPDNNIDCSIDKNIDKNQVEHLDVNIEACIDKKTLTESLQEQSYPQITNAELARLLNVSPTTVSRSATKKRQPPSKLEWRYDPSLKKWVK